jgi:hypothetical protein
MRWRSESLRRAKRFLGLFTRLLKIAASLDLSTDTVIGDYGHSGITANSTRQAVEKPSTVGAKERTQFCRTCDHRRQ